MADDPEETTNRLTVSPEKVCYIILKAREYDAKVAPPDSEMEEGSNPTDDDSREILEDYSEDATLAELRDAIESLNEDEIIEVIALAWLGRGDADVEEWSSLVALADERHRGRSADYLLGMPMLGDLLEEGLSALGYSCDDFERGHL
jgi:hypothetical protein